jgi:hypothetical protein
VAEVANLREAAVTIEELEEEIRRELDRKYAFYRMLTATDRVLWRLEELNLAGARELPEDGWRRIRQALAELPSACLERLRPGPRVQDVLDSVFDAQDWLLGWRNPDREVDDDQPPPVEPRRADRILQLVRDAGPDGLAWVELARHWVAGTRPTVLEMDRLVTAGALRCEMREPARGPAGRWYFTAGEGG